MSQSECMHHIVKILQNSSLLSTEVHPNQEQQS